MKNLTSKSHLCSSAYTTPPTQGQEGMPHETEPELFAPAAGRKKLDSIVVDVGCSMRISQSVECVYQYIYTYIYIYIHMHDMYYLYITYAWHVLSIYIYTARKCCPGMHICIYYAIEKKGYDWCKCTYRSINWIHIEKEWGCNGHSKPQKDAIQIVSRMWTKMFYTYFTLPSFTLTSHFQDSHCVLH